MIRVALDTDVLIIRAQKSPPADAAKQKRWELIHESVERHTRAGHELVVSAIVVAEVAAQLNGKVRLPFFGEVFDDECAYLAGALMGPALATRTTAQNRRALKADVLILASAIRHKCDVLLTGNKSDFIHILNGRNDIEIEAADEPSGQTVIPMIRRR